jgi:hypothetical protein
MAPKPATVRSFHYHSQLAVFDECVVSSYHQALADARMESGCKIPRKLPNLLPDWILADDKKESGCMIPKTIPNLLPDWLVADTQVESAPSKMIPNNLPVHQILCIL